MKRLNTWKRRMGLYKKSKAFTLIELIVVMAIIGILVLLAAPRFLGQTEEAIFTKHLSNARNVEDASERFYIAEQDWPRLSDEAYTSSEVEAYAETIFSITGEEMELDPDGDYYDIDYDALSDFVRVDASDKANYILQNPVGKVYYLEGLSESGENRVDFESPGDVVEEADEIPDYYVQATDLDFEKDGSGNWRYVGDDTHVIIPHVIEGEEVTSYRDMFRDTAVEGVVSDNSNVTNMRSMFMHSKATTIELSHFDSSNVTTMRNMFWGANASTLSLNVLETSKVNDMGGMFRDAKAIHIYLSSLDTSKVTTMSNMFEGVSATTLNLNHFDTSNVRTMSNMFKNSTIANLDLTSFDTSNVFSMAWMFDGSYSDTLELSSFDTTNIDSIVGIFRNSTAKKAYARTLEDAENFMSSSYVPTTLEIIVK